MIVIYGIPSCGSVKKALFWAKSHAIAHEFRNFRTEPIDAATLHDWVERVGLDVLCNKKGRFWRKLDAAQREALAADPAALEAFMLENPVLIKRPVIVYPDGTITAGVVEPQWPARC